jgi:hypothetical protein
MDRHVSSPIAEAKLKAQDLYPFWVQGAQPLVIAVSVMPKAQHVASSESGKLLQDASFSIGF